MKDALFIRFGGGVEGGLDAVVRPQAVQGQGGGEEFGVGGGLHQFVRVAREEGPAAVKRKDFDAPLGLGKARLVQQRVQAGLEGGQGVIGRLAGGPGARGGQEGAEPEGTTALHLDSRPSFLISLNRAVKHCQELVLPGGLWRSLSRKTPAGDQTVCTTP